MNQTNIDLFIVSIIKSLENETFVKMTLSNYKGVEPDLKNIYVKKIIIKNEPKLSCTYRYKTKDIVKNYSIVEFENKLNEFINVNKFTIVNFFDLHNGTQMYFKKNGELVLKISQVSNNEIIETKHDIEKKRLINQKALYLHHLKITDVNGMVYKNTQNKFKQINHYIELLSPLLQKMHLNGDIDVVDMGSGKGYLTFALYDYLQNNLHLATNTNGVEFRADLVKLCNAIARKAGFIGLNFSQGTILDYEKTKIDILIALHACDTATDDAIYKGITSNAKLIVVAPCCHKQIRKEIEKSKTDNELTFLTQYGIFLERQAEMVTDGLRALILEYFCYSVKIQQFISDAHTPKNVMITAVKKELKSEILDKSKKEILEKIKNTKAYFGIGKHYLEALLGI